MVLDLDKLAANAANAAFAAINTSTPGTNAFNTVKAAIRAVLVSENEACALIMDAYATNSPGMATDAADAAAAIRVGQP